ncbi:aminotransferase class I/II-fold pyridoxal phosphate-dependent enzyme [Maribacter algarum]|uniref:Aminotransferase class I/II-fold pyridoxal phosphate-dependent enzyme n=1 Tax=Maribacter algarum (ex Zhang et al. 2020) TaxID=2578118 RepID=A0A5S3PV40_9FLAO|nr:methionine aminotransferase [Maribacter algarum]TMM58876.1 aminotransferase class I/II-fold pyridoxal phosphate-dependent enzyme [Maribacter algarum]
MPLKSSFHSKLPNVKTTIFTIVGDLARKHNAIDLSQGFPNFEADPELIELACKAMRDGHNQYAGMKGLPELREVLSDKIEKQHGRYYSPETEVTVVAGATQAIYTAISAFVHVGDEVIVLKPAYDCYEPAIEVNGGITVHVELEAPNYQVDWEAFKTKISAKTRMVIINTPHNPIGRIFSENDMLQLQEILHDTNIILLSDEVYEHIIFDGEVHQSASRFEDLATRSIVCSSFGKTFHVTGWKIGYCVAPAGLMKEFQKVHQFNVFCVPRPVQHALATYLKTESHYLDLGAFYQQKRDFFLDAIKNSLFKFTPSQGSFFQILDYSDISDERDDALVKHLILEHKLASIPVSEFNLNHRNDGMLRFCFAKKEETLQEAAEILNKL